MCPDDLLRVPRPPLPPLQGLQLPLLLQLQRQQPEYIGMSSPSGLSLPPRFTSHLNLFGDVPQTSEVDHAARLFWTSKVLNPLSSTVTDFLFAPAQLS